mgnify:CR=1 FL=1
MLISIDLCIVSLGVQDPMAPYIAICEKVVEKKGLEHKLTSNGTGLEG